ncbi:MAG: TRL-like family protein [candidate division WOR-3 bacterium]
MKKTLLLSLIGLFLVSTFFGCGAMITMGGGGVLYQDTKMPLPYASYYAQGTDSYSKVGEASCTSILGIIVTGDASIKAAMENGGIRKIHHIDYQVTNILGIIATYKTIVYGE